MPQNNRKNADNVPSPKPSRREHPSTYVVQDRSNLDEMTRLHLQDQMVTEGMGGVLPEMTDLIRFQKVLDVGCGTGGWLIEAAKRYPTMKRLVGVDISSTMLDYAREQAKAEGVSDRVEFETMDALRLLDFRARTFDLVNQRLGASWLRKWDWPNVLQEYQRVACSGGIIRITESKIVLDSSSPSLNRLSEIVLEAGYQAGLYFTPTADGVISQLESLFTQHGLLQVQTHLHQLEHRAGTREGHLWAQNMEKAFRTMQPFLRKWTRVPDDYEALYQQMLKEMQQPDFVAPWNLLTVWGTNSGRNISSRD